MEVKRTFDLLEQLVTKYPKEDILAKRLPTGWKKFSTDDYYRKSHLLAYAFLALGYDKDDKIMTISNNRPEWNFTDMGATLIGAAFIPVYPTLSDDDYLHIIDHSDTKVLFIGNEQLLKKVAPIVEKVDREITIYTYDQKEGYQSIEDLFKLGEENEEKFKEVVEEIKANTDENHLATIIYTSGTTGSPKGVMLSHRNLVSNFIGTANQQIRGYEHIMLSFLPLSHIYERGMNYNYQYLGISTYYAEGLGTIARDLSEAKADGFCAVPRVLEMMFAKLEATGKELKGIKRLIYSWAFRIACKFDYENKGIYYNWRYSLADKLVYSKWREALGGKEMLVVSGGSSIRERVIRLFTAAKLYIFEGYGMTETSPVIAVNNPKEMIIKIGTVGKVMEGTECMIADDGEILTRGPHVMLGYYKDPEYTAEVIDEDGWLHTGDIGEIVDGIFLKITDRKKEIFKLSAGKYIAPQVIETLLKESPYIENSMVIGADEKFASALIVPNFPRLKVWLTRNRIDHEGLSNEEIVAKKEVVAKIAEQIKEINAKLAPHEQIRRPKLVCEEWTPQNDLLSQTLKLRRHAINDRYEHLIKDIYRTERE